MCHTCFCYRWDRKTKRQHRQLCCEQVKPVVFSLTSLAVDVCFDFVIFRSKVKIKGNLTSFFATRKLLSNFTEFLKRKKSKDEPTNM